MTAYIDPTVEPSTARERDLLAEIVHRGLSLHRVHATGAVHVHGPGVYVLAS